MKAILKKYNSPYFPFIISWKINNCSYSNVFENKESAINYIIGRLGNVKIIDKCN